MPGPKFTKKADTKRRRRMWDDVYRSALERGAGEGGAIRRANAVVADDKRKYQQRRR